MWLSKIRKKGRKKSSSRSGQCALKLMHLLDIAKYVIVYDVNWIMFRHADYSFLKGSFNDFKNSNGKYGDQY